MKTTLLSAALFLATASFAQTQANSNATVKGKSEIKSNKVKSDVNTASEANLQSNIIKGEHKAVAAEKSSASATANEKGKLISGIASDKSDASVQGKEKGKLISSIASDGKSESGSVHADVKGNADAGVKSEGHAKTHVKKIKQSGKKKRKALAAEKSATANEKGKRISSIASDKSDASVQGKAKGELISSIASDGKSQSGSVHSGVKGDANASVKSKGHVKTHVKKIKRSGKKVKTSSANTIHTGAAAAHAVKIKPVSVKANNGVGVHIN